MFLLFLNCLLCVAPFLGGFLLGGNQMAATGSQASCFQIHVLQEKVKFSKAGTEVARLNFLGSDWPV